MIGFVPWWGAHLVPSSDCIVKSQGGEFGMTSPLQSAAAPAEYRPEFGLDYGFVCRPVGGTPKRLQEATVMTGKFLSKVLGPVKACDCSLVCWSDNRPVAAVPARGDESLTAPSAPSDWR